MGKYYGIGNELVLIHINFCNGYKKDVGCLRVFL